jgi:hypothetical protein
MSLLLCGPCLVPKLTNIAEEATRRPNYFIHLEIKSALYNKPVPQDIPLGKKQLLRRPTHKSGRDIQSIRST